MMFVEAIGRRYKRQADAIHGDGPSTPGDNTPRQKRGEATIEDLVKNVQGGKFDPAALGDLAAFHVEIENG